MTRMSMDNLKCSNCFGKVVVAQAFTFNAEMRRRLFSLVRTTPAYFGFG